MSLLKRIEKGQPGKSPSSDEEGADSSSRLMNLQARRVAPPGVNTQRDTYFDLKTRVQNRLLAELDPAMDISQSNDVRNTIQELFEQVLAEENIVLSRPERHRLFEQIAAEILGFGPLQPLLEDESITEVMVNGPKNIYIERGGKIHKVPVAFESDDHVMRIIDRIVAPMGRRIEKDVDNTVTRYVYDGGNTMDTCGTATGITRDADTNHTKFGNVLFGDGHVKGFAGSDWRTKDNGHNVSTWL